MTMAKPITVSDRQMKVLRYLAHGEYGYAYYFSSIARGTKMRKDEVRRACRALARKKLAEHIRGLFTDDGMVAGSGYSCTPAGRKFLETRK